MTRGTHFTAGAAWITGTNVPSNVTGECGHRHRSAEAAQRCIDAMARAIRRGHNHGAYCDRVVMVCHRDGVRHPLGAHCAHC